MNGRASGSRSQYGASGSSYDLERLSISTPSTNTYEVQHLKTFTSDPGSTPPGMAQVVELLDRQPPVFVHNYRMVIRRDRSEPILSIVDPWKGNQESEWFPIQKIRAPRFKTDSSKPNNNNLLMFKIDAHSFQRNEPAKNEIHVFQVLSSPAQDIVDQLVNLGADPDYSLVDHRAETPEFTTSRRFVSNGFQRKSPRAPSVAYAERGTNKFYPTSTLRGNSLPRASGTFQAAKDQPMYKYDIDITAEEISTSLINAEVLLLNYCFDDVEEIIQLMRDRPEKNRRKSSVMIPAGAMNKYRNRLQSRGSIIPSECRTDPSFRLLVEDFFQKLKFATILLSRLCDYVQEPKAPVIIKKLFDLLQEGVNICRLPKSNRADIPRSIVYPRFPRETLQFLDKYLTPVQASLLHELGPAWNTPREEARDSVVYVPDFRNPFDIDRDNYDPTLFKYNDEDVDNDPERRYIQSARLSRYAKDLMSRGADLVKVIMSYRAKSPRELTVQMGEYLELLDEFKDWFRVRNSLGEEGTCPSTVLRKIERITGSYQPRGSIFLHRGDGPSKGAF